MRGEPSDPAVPVKLIQLDASGWKTVSDFYGALLALLGSPHWHGQSIDALIDSMIWGGINEVCPPYKVIVVGHENLPADVLAEVRYASDYLAKARDDFKSRRGGDVDVRLVLGSETLPPATETTRSTPLS